MVTNYEGGIITFRWTIAVFSDSASTVIYSAIYFAFAVI